MMVIQSDFDSIIKLLEKNNDLYRVDNLLSSYKSSEVTFYCMNEASIGNRKEHLLDIYQIRGKIEGERKHNPLVFGYDTLLANLEKTEHSNICISTISTNHGSYIIFSDFAKIDLIGVLFSQATLRESRDKMDEHKKIVEGTGGNVQYDYTKNENIFINGILIKKK